MASPIDKVEYSSRLVCPLHEVLRDTAAGKLYPFSSVYDSLTARTFRILRCPICGAGLTDPYRSESTVRYLYEGRTSVSNFDPIHGTVMDKIKDIFARQDLRHVHALAGKPGIDSVLDFGAGYWRFSIASKKCFPLAKVHAVDFDLEPPPPLQQCTSGMHYLSLEAFHKTSDQYDLIILRGVIEHVHDPIALLRMLKLRMTAKGILYIEAPNIDSAYIHYFGSLTNAWGVPYHLVNFDLGSMMSLIRDSGLKGRIFHKGLPLAGCVLAALLKQERSLVHQFAGIVLHPVQLLMEWKMGKYILAAVCRKI